MVRRLAECRITASAPSVERMNSPMSSHCLKVRFASEDQQDWRTLEEESKRLRDVAGGVSGDPLGEEEDKDGENAPGEVQVGLGDYSRYGTTERYAHQPREDLRAEGKVRNRSAVVLGAHGAYRGGIERPRRCQSHPLRVQRVIRRHRASRERRSSLHKRREELSHRLLEDVATPPSCTSWTCPVHPLSSSKLSVGGEQGEEGSRDA